MAIVVVRIAVPQVLLEHVSSGRFDPFVVLIFRLDNFEAEFLIEIYSALVIHLHVPGSPKGKRRKGSARCDSAELPAAVTHKYMLSKFPSSFT